MEGGALAAEEKEGKSIGHREERHMRASPSLVPTNFSIFLRFPVTLNLWTHA